MRFDLAEMTRRAANPRRSTITLREIRSPRTRATDLFNQAYRPTLDIWRANTERILAEYSRSIDELQTDSPADLERVLSQVTAQGEGLVIEARIALAAWATRLEAWHRARWRQSVLSQTRVDLATLIGPADARETIEHLIARNVSLVSSVSEQTRARIADSVFRGLTNRTPVRDVAREIRQAMAMSRRRALNIAADQNVKLTSALNEERRRQAGIDSFEWVHSGKVNHREHHVARNGKLYSENSERVGEEYQGKRIRAVPEDRPGELPYCGCTGRAVLIIE